MTAVQGVCACALHATTNPARVVRACVLAILNVLLAACGGGSSGEVPDPSRGSIQSTSISSQSAVTTYALSIYLPPAAAGPRQDLPVIFALDGESWFQTLIAVTESARSPAIVVAVHSAGQRNRDFVPAGSCTPDGGGHAKYLEFLRRELIPYIDSHIGGNAAKRVLFGHSHGGSFVLYALFAEGATAHSFSAYLAVDSSISCFRSTADGWQQGYASVYGDLPVRLQIAYATQGNYASNLDYGQSIARHHFAGFSLLAQDYNGTHGGIVPQALSDGLAFALGR